MTMIDETMGREMKRRRLAGKRVLLHSLLVEHVIARAKHVRIHYHSI